MQTRAAAARAPQPIVLSLTALVELTKPRITRLVLLMALLGGVVADGAIDLLALAWTGLGTCLVVAAANTLNMFLEQEEDGLMERTRGRPLPSGRISPELALVFGVALAALGTFILGQFVNPLTCQLAMMAFVSYVLVYTPLKAVSQIALYVGAVPGALPPLLGYAGQTASLSLEAWALFAILFVWQLPHFLAIAVFRRGDYAQAGLKVMPVVSGLANTRRGIIVLSALLLGVSLLPAFTALASPLYTVAAAISGTLFLGYAVRGPRAGDIDGWARRLFFASMPHLVLLFTLLALVAP